MTGSKKKKKKVTKATTKKKSYFSKNRVSKKKTTKKKSQPKKGTQKSTESGNPFLLEQVNEEHKGDSPQKSPKYAKSLISKIKKHKPPKNKNYTTFQKAIRSKRVYANKAKREIAIDMLERYTGHSIEDFQPQIILTNFHYYIERFNALLDDHEYTTGSAFKASSSKSAQISIIEFGIGSAMAALVMELVSVIEPKAVLFLGMCGAIHSSLNVGDFILPIGAIRADSVSQHFMPPQVPALSTFKVQKFASQVLVDYGFDYRTGMVHTTDLRFWEFDTEFKRRLYQERVIAVEMECASLFITGFASKVSVGAMLLVSDCPLKRGGIKTKSSASKVFKKYTDIHIELGMEIMTNIAEKGEAIRHYRWD